MPTDPPTGPGPRITRITYDARGRVISHIDLTGQVPWIADDGNDGVLDRDQATPTDPDDGPPDEPHIIG